MAKRKPRFAVYAHFADPDREVEVVHECAKPEDADAFQRDHRRGAGIVGAVSTFVVDREAGA